MVELSLQKHVASIHWRSVSHKREVDTGGVVGGYRVTLPRFLAIVAYPVEVFPETAHTPGRLQDHFVYIHCNYQVLIVW